MNPNITYPSKGHIDVDNFLLIRRCLTTAEDPELTVCYGLQELFLVRDMLYSYPRSFKFPNANPHTWPEFMPILDRISNQKYLGNISQSWFNVSKQSGFMQSHSHLLAISSVLVYYPRLENNHTSIEFLIENEWIPVPCISGDWLHFPKEMEHRVPAGPDNSGRISISINL
jgi:hypothetical protein